jgi:hypothetical protein
MKTKLIVILIGMMTLLSAQETRPLPQASESEPEKYGWMKGFPPPPDRVLRFSDGSFFQFPQMRWSVVNFRQLMPTVRVFRGLDAPDQLPEAIRTDIDSLKFIPDGQSEPMTWAASLTKNYSDGILILHKGRIVYERYFGALAEDQVHAAMSVTKSFVGTLAAMLVFEGKLDTTKMVGDYIPELTASAFADATVRQIMDMTTGLQFSEDYADPNAEIWAFSAAGNPLPKPEGYTGPASYYEYLQTVKKKGAHGEAFGYKTVNTEVLGWIIARISGLSVAELLSERIWRRLGMEQSAYFTVDGIGTPFAGGGLNAGLRDMARFGEMIRNNGLYKGVQIIPEAAVKDIRRGGSRDAFAKAGYDLEGWSYRNMWWITNNKHGAFAARGVHGQTIYIDPAAEMVIVRFASHPVAANAANDAYSLPAYQAVAEYLMINDVR